jgi:heat shock protein HtpX
MKWFWHLRTASMFIVLTLVLVLVGVIIGSLFGSALIGLVLMCGISVIITLYSYFFSKRNALRANRVHLVTEAEEPRLYHLVKDVADKAGLPMPEVGVTEEMMPNAFATGRNPKNAAVVATRGILDILPDDELEGVFAHEMSHVKNRDILVMSVASTVASVLTYASRYAALLSVFGGEGGNGKNKGAGVVLAVLLYITVPIAALLIQMGISRNREYLADETGGRITRNPRALARALGHIEKGCASPRNNYDNTSYADMWIANPLRKGVGVLSNMFSTHPPMDKRIERLNKLADELENGNVPEYVPSEDSSKSKLTYAR